MSLWGVIPENYRTYQSAGRSDRPGVNVGLPRLNFPPRWRTRLNTLWWPSGATRWAQFVGIATGQTLTKILNAVESSGETSVSQPAQLVMSDLNFNGQPADNSFVTDDSNLTCLSTEMYLLGPRQITQPGPGSDTLWLLPLVDERYYWQWRAADLDGFSTGLPPQTSTQWGVLLDQIGGKVDAGGINRSDIDTAYKGPDAIQWYRRWTLGTFLEAASCCVGQRIIRNIDRTVSSDSFGDSQQTYNTNTADNGKPPTLICGGDTSNVHRHGNQAGSVEVRFSQHPEDNLNMGSGATAGAPAVPIESKTIDVGSIAGAGGVGAKDAIKRYFTNAHTTSNEDASALATAIAKAYYGWQQTSFDFVFAGLKQWDQSGFDDAVEWRMDFDPRTKQYAFFTRVQSLPPNVGFSDFPQVIDWDAQTVVVVKLLTDLSNMGSAQAEIQDTPVVSSEDGTLTWASNKSNKVTVWDGLGLCDPIKAGAIGFAIALRNTNPAPYQDFGYFMVAVKCDCTSS